MIGGGDRRAGLGEGDPQRGRRDAASNTDVAFFTVGDSNYFLGVVGLVNSLRLVGHKEPIVVLDCGLTAEQRELLSSECTLVTLPKAEKKALFAGYYKLFAPRQSQYRIMVIIDSDMIVTGNLTSIIEGARAGRIVTFADPQPTRWFAEWQEIHELPSPPRRQTYLCSGVVAFDTQRFPNLMEDWWKACQRTIGDAFMPEGVADGPTAQADQDALPRSQGSCRLG